MALLPEVVALGYLSVLLVTFLSWHSGAPLLTAVMAKTQRHWALVESQQVVVMVATVAVVTQAVRGAAVAPSAMAKVVLEVTGPATRA